MQRYRARGAPFPVHKAPRMPKNRSKKCTWYQARRHVCAKARLRNPDGESSVTRCGISGPRNPKSSATKTPLGTVPRGPPGLKKFQSREAILKKSSFQCGMKFSIENEIFIPGPSLATEKTGPGIEIFNRECNFRARMKISCVGECFFFFFFMRSSEN